MAIGAVQAHLPLPNEERPSQSQSASGAEAFGDHVRRASLQQTAQAQATSTLKATAQRQAVAPQKTPLSGEQAASAIEKAYQELTGEKPSKATLAILTSHWSLETGQGQKMYNFNFAGIKGTSPEGLTAVMRTREGYGDHAVKIRDGFRAYSTAEAGAKDYVSLLLRRYSEAVDQAALEDPSGFASKLKERGYYTGNEQLYAQGITRLANRAMEYGLNALGGSAGEVSAKPDVIEGYFQSPPAAPPGAWPSSQGGSLQAAWSGIAGLQGLNPGGGVQAMADEITRAALAIAAERGAGS